mgnify:CR=1 FL=1
MLMKNMLVEYTLLAIWHMLNSSIFFRNSKGNSNSSMCRNRQHLKDNRHHTLAILSLNSMRPHLISMTALQH